MLRDKDTLLARMSDPVIAARDLRKINRSVDESEPLSNEELAEGWLQWFEKRGDRYLKSAAAFGYTEITLDLPWELAQSPPDKPVLRALAGSLRLLVPGCSVCFVEEEYEDQILFKVEISWKKQDD
jgi:hypothetical protein